MEAEQSRQKKSPGVSAGASMQGEHIRTVKAVQTIANHQGMGRHQRSQTHRTAHDFL
jgi:hypothetical protein